MITPIVLVLSAKMSAPGMINCWRYRGNDNKRYEGGTVADTLPVAYPKEWFDKNREKPPLVIHGKEWTMDDMEKSIYFMINTGREVNEQIIVNYLFRVFFSLPMKLQEEWTSFGIRIGGKDDDVTLENIFKVTYENKEYPKKADIIVPDHVKPCLPLIVCCVYRYASTQNEDYKKKLDLTIKPIVRTKMNGNEIPYMLFQDATGWLLFGQYRKIIAGIDMFLLKFPEHPNNLCRLGTLGTRYKDCAALTSWSYFARMANLPFAHAGAWLWTADLADEFFNLVEPDQEISKFDSYMPYFMEMQLAKKSPYSATHNPNLYFFVHGVGCASSRLRSINARDVGEARALSLVNQVIVVGMALCKNRDYGKQITFNPKEGPRDNLLEIELADDPDIPIGAGNDDDNISLDSHEDFPPPSDSNPRSWLIWFVEQKYDVPPIYAKQILRNLRQIKNPRKGTVGETMKIFATKDD